MLFVLFLLLSSNDLDIASFCVAANSRTLDEFTKLVDFMYKSNPLWSSWNIQMLIWSATNQFHSMNNDERMMIERDQTIMVKLKHSHLLKLLVFNVVTLAAQYICKSTFTVYIYVVFFFLLVYIIIRLIICLVIHFDILSIS